MGTPVPQHPQLVSRVLDNGLELHVLRNTTPADRLQVYLEVKCGSIHELEHEQGIAHFVEHAVFLGTTLYPTAEAIKARLAQLGMSFGADSNAFTDFRQTVFTLNCCLDPTRADSCASAGRADAETTPRKRGLSTRSAQPPTPCSSQLSPPPAGLSLTESPRVTRGAGGRMTRQRAREMQGVALEAACELLYQLAFEALMLEDAVGTERGAVLSEEQSRDTPDYRAEVASLQHMFVGTLLPTRLPIGKRDLIESWGASDLKHFYRTHYRPENMRLYVVGPVDAADAISLAEGVFKGASAAPDAAPATPLPETALQLLPPSSRVVVHQDELLTQFELVVTSRVPLSPVRTVEDIRLNLLDGLVMHALADRLEAVQQAEAAPPFVSAGWGYEDSFRSGCGALTLSVTAAEVREWKEAVVAVAREVQRMRVHGLARAEMEHTCQAFMRELLVQAEQVHTTPSSEMIESLLECTAMGQTLMDSAQEYDVYHMLLHPPPSSPHKPITLKEVNARAKEVLQFVVDAALPTSPPSKPAPKRHPTKQGAFNAVACRRSPGIFVAAPLNLGPGLGADSEARAERLVLSETDVLRALSEALSEVPPPVVVDVPLELIPGAHLRDLAALAEGPCFVERGSPSDERRGAEEDKTKENRSKEQEGRDDEDGRQPLDAGTINGGLGSKTPGNTSPKAQSQSAVDKRAPARKPHKRRGPPRHVHAESGVCQLLMSNGVRVVYKQTQFECGQVSIQVTARGGRALETAHKAGAVTVGIQALLGGGACGHSAEVVGKYAELHGVDFTGNVNAERLWLRSDCGVSGGGLERGLELMHLFLKQCVNEENRWDTAACERAKRDYRHGHEIMQRDLDLLVGAKLTEMMTPDHRFTQPLPSQVAALDASDLGGSVARQLVRGNVHVAVVGDFNPQQLESLLLLYIGGLTFPEVSAVTSQEGAAAVGKADGGSETVNPGDNCAVRPCPQGGCGGGGAGEGVDAVKWGRLGESGRVVLKSGAKRAVTALALPSAGFWGRMPWDVLDVERPANAGEENGGSGTMSSGSQIVGGKRKQPEGEGPREMDPLLVERMRHPLWCNRVLNLLSDVIENRLFQEVREKQGLVYHISFGVKQYEYFFQHGIALIHLNPDPKKIDSTIAEVHKVLADLRGGNITEEEILAAQSPLLNSLRSAMQCNEWWLNRCVTVALNNSGVEHISDLLNFYGSLTISDLLEAMRMYFPHMSPMWEVVGVGGDIV
eukprot:CAMPEP_0114302658 /NCGR_PEP_ID=MMETSP0059-20121206/14780_1 /TAXON_ID=36894 /ORGANISM="Pyramimonas parkeae, Strain CCMP726" /LENGTH=1232 /DNA_ID=CAMNT_0001425523 /DNA_START=207 /DNA_END=3905 /DNA_ORIENTATION=-